MKAFLDTNILLDLLFDREKRIAVEQALEEPYEEFWISALTVNFVMYQVEIKKLPKPTIWAFLNRFKITPLTQEDLDWSQTNDAGDFEDALQVAAARRENCHVLITGDQAFAKMYGKHINVVTIS